MVNGIDGPTVASGLHRFRRHRWAVRLEQGSILAPDRNLHSWEFRVLRPYL